MQVAQVLKLLGSGQDEYFDFLPLFRATKQDELHEGVSVSPNANS